MCPQTSRAPKCEQLRNGTCWEAGRQHRCASIPGPVADAARWAGGAPHRACLGAARSAALCGPKQWLCWDTGVFSAAAAMLDWREPDEVLRREPPNATATVVAVLAAATARGQAAPSLETCPLFAALLPSLLATADAGFEYWVYVGFDAGDPFYDNRTSLRAARAWFRARAAALRAARGAVARIAFVRFLNALSKPGPAFNFLAAAALRDGADYFYRVNDDSEFLTPWARPLVAALVSLDPPNVGVAGPTCREGQATILTHDFTHRTHQAVFGPYYPEELSDWFMDGWITAAYPGPSTYRHPAVAVRHRLARRRYDVDLANRALLPPRIAAARAVLAAFLEARCGRGGGWRRCAGLPPPPADPATMALRGPLNRTGFRQTDMRFRPPPPD
jgi:hypothetical protein